MDCKVHSYLMVTDRIRFFQKTAFTNYPGVIWPKTVFEHFLRKAVLKITFPTENGRGAKAFGATRCGLALMTNPDSTPLENALFGMHNLYMENWRGLGK